MEKKKYWFGALLLGLFVKVMPAQAICPVCVVAVGAGLGISEYLGIDDSIAGLWIGAMLVAVSIWTIEYFKKKNWLSKISQLRDILIFLAYYVLTIWPLWEKGFIGGSFHQLFGIDKLILGIIVGSIFFSIANWTYQVMKKKNGGHAHFPLEKVVIPVSTLIVLSFVFYFLSR